MKTILYQALESITFNGLIIPVSEFIGEGKTYITYQLLSEPVSMSADDDEESTVIHFSVDLYTNNSDFDSLVKTIRKRLKNAGFAITNRGPEIYDNEHELYHIVTDCSIENLEEE